MNIAVIAMAFSGYGTLTVYTQFLEALNSGCRDDNYHLFVADWMPKPSMRNVSYHVIKKRKGIHRIWFDFIGFKLLSKKIGVKWDVVVSLQGVPAIYDRRVRSITYFHQALPLYKYPIAINDRFAKTYYMYHYVYPLYVKLLLKYTDFMAVQTNVIKKKFSQKFKYDEDKIGVFFPNSEMPSNIEGTCDRINNNYINFIFPGTANTYKEHLTLVKALLIIKEKYPSYLNRFKIHFTAKESDNTELFNFIKSKGFENVFCFQGTMPHDDLLRMYKSCDGLLFPSVIETVGLPLLEAANFGLPVIANDIDFVHEVLIGYKGIEFVTLHDYNSWAKHIISIIDTPQKFNPYRKDNNNAWERFFDLIRMGCIV